MGLAIFNKPKFNSQMATLAEALTLPAFNAMYAVGADSPANSCKDPNLGLNWIKNVIHDFIKVKTAKVEYNFFFDLFGFTPIKVDTTDIYNHYTSDFDNNVYFENHKVAAGAGLAVIATLMRGHHTSNGATSYPAKGMFLVDKEEQIWYSIEDKDVTNDFGHRLTLKPILGDIVGEISPNKKYLVSPGRFVNGNSTAMDHSVMPSIGWAQKVNPMRIRCDWKMALQLNRGYQDHLRFVVTWAKDGTLTDSWDALEAQNARQNLQLTKNLVAFMGTPITNNALIEGAGATNVDKTNVGFYGYFPSIKYGGGRVKDFDPAFGLDVDADFEPFILQNEALKQVSRFLIRHGKTFKAKLINRTNKMARINTGDFNWQVYTRMGENLKKNEISGYEFLGAQFDFQEWGTFSDTRLMGSPYYENVAIGTPIDGLVDAKTNASVNAMEFYQHGMKESSGYEEYVHDNRQDKREETIMGWCAESMMMATHLPEHHFLLNPVSGCK